MEGGGGDGEAEGGGGAHGASASRRTDGGAYAASTAEASPSLMAEASPSLMAEASPDETATSAAVKREKRNSVANGPATSYMEALPSMAPSA